jgi:hypothetical protein
MAGLEPAIHVLGAKRMDARRTSAMAWCRDPAPRAWQSATNGRRALPNTFVGKAAGRLGLRGHNE